MQPIKIYLSAPIRGKKGENATKEEIEENILKGKHWANTLRIIFGHLIEVWCPHEYDRAFDILYSQGKITIKEILDIDFEILKEQDLVIAFTETFSNGVEEEINFANKINKPVIKIENDVINHENVCRILEIILNILKNRKTE